MIISYILLSCVTLLQISALPSNWEIITNPRKFHRPNVILTGPTADLAADLFQEFRNYHNYHSNYNYGGRISINAFKNVNPHLVSTANRFLNSIKRLAQSTHYNYQFYIPVRYYYPVETTTKRITTTTKRTTTTTERIPSTTAVVNGFEDSFKEFSRSNFTEITEKPTSSEEKSSVSQLSFKDKSLKPYQPEETIVSSTEKYVLTEDEIRSVPKFKIPEESGKSYPSTNTKIYTFTDHEIKSSSDKSLESRNEYVLTDEEIKAIQNFKTPEESVKLYHNLDNSFVNGDELTEVDIKSVSKPFEFEETVSEKQTSDNLNEDELSLILKSAFGENGAINADLSNRNTVPETDLLNQTSLNANEVIKDVIIHNFTNSEESESKLYKVVFNFPLPNEEAKVDFSQRFDSIIFLEDPDVKLIEEPVIDLRVNQNRLNLIVPEDGFDPEALPQSNLVINSEILEGNPNKVDFKSLGELPLEESPVFDQKKSNLTNSYGKTVDKFKRQS